MKGTRAEIAWAAGLFEGEGCIYTHPAPKVGGTLCLRTTDPDVLERFRRIVACGVIHGPLPIARAHHKPSYDWRINRWEDIECVLRAFHPWLGARRKAKAEALLAQPVLGLPGGQTKSHCKRDHPLSGPGADVAVKWLPDGRMQRVCRACRRERTTERKAVA